jgi:hypothetical protein
MATGSGSESNPFAHLCGWSDVPERHMMAAMMPKFADAGRDLMTRMLASDPVFLYKAWKDTCGDYIPYMRQEIGDCVSFGHAHGNDLCQCVEASLERIKFTREEIETDTEALYGMAREAGNMLGGQDGCYGSAAVKAMTTMGVIARKDVSGDYSGKRAKDWGYHGAPKEVKEKAAQWKLGSAALVRTWEELVTAMSNGYPVTICTGMGFTMERDSDGFCHPKGHWGHCMLLCGIRFDKPGACVFQSWGPNVPSGPLALDQPNNSFWVGKDSISRILGEGDSWALSKSPYFRPRPLPSHWSYSVAA